MLCCLLALCVPILTGCGKKADETKPISDVKAEADKMDASQLKAMATTYKNAIVAKKDDVNKLMTKLKEIPLDKKLGEESKKLTSDLSDVNKSLQALQERFQIYVDKLKAKGGDTSGLQI